MNAVYVRAGKSLATTCTKVSVELKLPPQVVFAEKAPSAGNHVRFRLSPQADVLAVAVGGWNTPR
jgi:glucose-6-phosphate 1-dehydrogenase